MNLSIIITTCVCVATFCASVGVSTFVSGMRWGIVTRDIDYMQRDIRAIMEYFRLAPRSEEHKNRR
jgi:hypothetical protein